MQITYNRAALDIGTPRASVRVLLMTLVLPLAPAIGHVHGVAAAAPQGNPDPLAVKTIVEVESKRTEGGREVVKLVPADRVVPGE